MSDYSDFDFGFGFDSDDFFDSAEDKVEKKQKRARMQDYEARRTKLIGAHGPRGNAEARELLEEPESDELALETPDPNMELGEIEEAHQILEKLEKEDPGVLIRTSPPERTLKRISLRTDYFQHPYYEADAEFVDLEKKLTWCESHGAQAESGKPKLKKAQVFPPFSMKQYRKKMEVVFYPYDLRRFGSNPSYSIAEITDFIAGHLFNAEMGGFGSADNLVPLTRTANHEHCARIETSVKRYLPVLYRFAKTEKSAAADKGEWLHSPIVGLYYCVEVLEPFYLVEWEGLYYGKREFMIAPYGIQGRWEFRVISRNGQQPLKNAIPDGEEQGTPLVSLLSSSGEEGEIARKFKQFPDKYNDFILFTNFIEIKNDFNTWKSEHGAINGDFWEIPRC
jgi:hypothetical protein